MARVLILANSSSGLYGFRNELVNELVKKYEVYASLPDKTNNKELEAEGVKIIETPINRRGMNPTEDFKLFKSYMSLMKEIRPDAIYGKYHGTGISTRKSGHASEICKDPI